LAKSAEQSAKAAPAKPTLATAAKAMVFGYLKFIAVSSFGFIEVRSAGAGQTIVDLAGFRHSGLLSELRIRPPNASIRANLGAN
jgi:hypothetical protein